MAGGNLLAQDGYTVTGIKYSGNISFGPYEFSQYMTTYPTGGFSRTILRKESFRYSEEILQADLSRIKKFYQTEGFLKAVVRKGKLDINAADRQLVIHIDIEEGPPVLVDEIHFDTGQIEPAADRAIADSIVARLNATHLLKPGRRFRDADLQADQTHIVSALNDLGFPLADASPALTVAANRESVRIDWTVVPGPHCVFGAVSVTGNLRYSSELIMRQLDFDQGDIFSQARIKQSQKQVYALGTFEVVVISALLGERAGNVVPIRVQIREAPRWTTKFGAGYGNEEKIRLFTDLRRLAVFGGARRLHFYAKRSNIEPYNIDASITQPAFLSPKNSANVNPFLLRQEEPGYTVGRYGNRLSLQRQFSDFNSSSIGYTFERVDLIAASAAEDESLVDSLGIYNKSSVTGRFIRNSSSPLLSPGGGMFAALSTTYSGLGFNSTFHFTKLALDARHYLGVATGLILASRIKIGNIFSYDDDDIAPVEERFYSGGSSSVRGWGRAQLGPVDSDGIPRGGKSILEGSLEVRFPIYSYLSGVSFIDAGNVWFDSKAQRIDELRYAAGAGIRFDTPIGPLRFDAARPVNDIDSQWQFHISVGQAF